MRNALTRILPRCEHAVEFSTRTFVTEAVDLQRNDVEYRLRRHNNDGEDDGIRSRWGARPILKPTDGNHTVPEGRRQGVSSVGSSNSPVLRFMETVVEAREE